MTTDPQQPESTPSIESPPARTPADAVFSAGTFVVDVSTAAVETGAVTVQPSDTSATHDGGSAGARIREKMSSTSAELVPDSTESSPAQTSRASRTIEIPSADVLEESLEAEISAAMSLDTTTPPLVIAEETEEVAADGAKPKEVGSGTKLKGTVQAIHGGEVFLEAGLRNNIVIPTTQFPPDKQPALGDVLDVIIDTTDGDGLIKGRIPRGRHRARGDWDSLAVGQIVDCLVSAVNKGGLQVTVSNLRAFLPASQVELGFAGNLEGYVGQKLTVQITEVNAKKRNLVVSRRALLQAERSEGEGSFWSAVEVGQDFKGIVKTLKDYGAFVNIGPVDGFLHIGEISWSRINHPKDILAEGQEIDVIVLKLDPEKKRISLGMKQLAQNPWANATDKYSSGRTVSGKVTRTTDFGAFIELETGLEGMVHISELAWRRVGSVGEVLTIGETRDFQVVEVDPKRKRVSLSLKALEKRPEQPKSLHQEAAEAAPAESRRTRNPNLRGGTGTNSGGRGMFGNPSDFS